MLREQHQFFRSVLMVADLGLIVAADLLAYRLRFDLLAGLLPPDGTGFSYRVHAIPVLVAAPLLLAAMIWARLYVPRRDLRFHREAAAIARGVLVGVVLSVAFTSLFRNVLFDGIHYSGWQFAVFGVVCFLLLVAWRFAFRTALRMLRARGWNLRHVAIIGTGRLGQVAYKTFQRNTWTGIKPAYFISHHATSERRNCLGVPVCGGLDGLDQVLDDHPVSGVILAVPAKMLPQLPVLMARLERHAVDVRVVPDVNPRYLPVNMTVGELDGMPMLSVRESPLASGWGRVIKRGLDIGGALAALVIFAIPMAIIALAVRRSGAGPVIFRQERMSLSGQRFEIFKFRTMTNLDAEQQTLRALGGGTAAWTSADDPRITKVGRLLRRTSLDELPQLLNVLLGEMSLVGPRPERPELIERFREDWRGYMLRQRVKAGMTGWAQIHGLRGRTSLRKRLQYDLFYIRNWSIGLDLRILLLTLWKGFAHANAG